MKSLMLILTLFVIMSDLGAQQVLNGSFESWNTTFPPGFPVGWKNNGHWPSTGGPPIITSERTAEAFSGDWAVKLSNRFGQPGLLANGTPGTFENISHGVAYTGRPAQMEFWYKFAPVGGDTAVATVRLIKLQANGGFSHVVGEGRYEIIGQTQSYTLATVPITYYTFEVPEVLQIRFLTIKCGSCLHDSTALWLDYVDLTGGVLGFVELAEQTSQVFPNPANNSFIVQLPATIAQGKFLLYNLTGQLVREINFVNDSQFVVERQQLPAGLYLYKIDGANQIKSVGKIAFE